MLATNVIFCIVRVGGQARVNLGGVYKTTDRVPHSLEGTETGSVRVKGATSFFKFFFLQ